MSFITEIGLVLPPECTDVAVLVGNPRVFATENGFLIDAQRLAIGKALLAVNDLEHKGFKVHLFSALDHNFRPNRSHRSDSPDLFITCDTVEDAFVEDLEVEVEFVVPPQDGLRQLFARDLLDGAAASQYTVSKAHRLIPTVSHCIDAVRGIFPEDFHIRTRLLLEQAVFNRARIDIQSHASFLDSVLRMQNDQGGLSDSCIRIPVPCFAIYGATYDLAARFDPKISETGRFVPGLRDCPMPVVFFAQSDLHFPNRVLVSKIANGMQFALDEGAYDLPEGYVSAFFVTHKGEVKNLNGFNR